MAQHVPTLTQFETARPPVMGRQMPAHTIRGHTIRGRGVFENESGRYEPLARVPFHDGWGQDEAPPPLTTHVTEETPRRIITTNKSPDVPFNQSINAYRGCEHGCVYCFARPTHAYMGLSPGLVFESRLFAKPNAAELLRKELSAKNYVPQAIAMGTNTDPYQPIEKRYEITRSLLEVMEEFNHPVGIITKSHLVTRDLDILSRLAKKNLVKVCVSVTSLDRTLSRSMEPRASTPLKRLAALQALSDAGIPTGVMVAPIIPALNEAEIEAILTKAAAAGVAQAGYVMLRLPLEVRPLFQDWIEKTVPSRAAHIMRLVTEMRGGKTYESRWGVRMKGRGAYAKLIRDRFRATCKRLGLNQSPAPLATHHYKCHIDRNGQLALF